MTATTLARARRGAGLLGAAGVAVFVVCALVPAPAARAGTRSPAPAAGTAGTAPACAADATCVTIPAKCPSHATCPTVSAEPVTDLGTNQWIYLDLSGFPAGSTAYIYFCGDNTALTGTAPPYCLLSGTADFSWPVQTVPISPEGTASLSFETIDDPHVKGDEPLLGEIPGESTLPPLNFYCGDAADLCSVDVMDWALLPPPLPSNIGIPLPSDTAVIPLGFAPPSTGCPRAANTFTYSDYSPEWLFPRESPVACRAKNPAIAINTASSTTIALSGLAGDSVVFLDDPQSAQVQAALASSRYSVVPIAASAVVMAYNAAMERDGLKFPFNSFELTPNEVAGLLTYAYEGPYDADMVSCPGGTCSLMEELNSVPSYVPAGQYGSFVPSEASSVTEAFTNWVCNAPNLPVVVDGRRVTDPNTAARTLTESNGNGYGGTGQPPWPITRCAAFDQFPPLKPLQGLFSLQADPIHQVKALRSFSPPAGFQAAPVAGFAPLDWGDARYNGLDAASLQNAAGQFVAPTVASVEAEIAAEPLSKAGYPLPEPRLAVKGGYPLATVIDALVPDSPLPAAQSKPIAEMMTELLNWVTTAPLPDGYAPLPPKLVAVARADLATALKAETAPPSLPTTTKVSLTREAVTSGTPVTYEAAVSAASGTPTGTVTFTSGASLRLCEAPLEAGRASCTAADAPVGRDEIEAVYSGATGFAGSTAAASLVVSAPPVPTTVATTAPPTTVAPPGRPPTTVAPRGRARPSRSKGAAAEHSIADVILTAADARLALPVALAVGGALIVLSLLFAGAGRLRRGRASRPGDAHA